LIDDALALERAGAFAIVLETIPAPLAKDITARLHIPTIGIGAGPNCDGQVQVYHDLLGFTEDHLPKHARRYATLADTIRQAVASYANDVKEGQFPTEENSFQMDETTLAALYGDGHS
jgi:3-methyl-2-oxobutanoate hydroxymethyltransferase